MEDQLTTLLEGTDIINSFRNLTTDQRENLLKDMTKDEWYVYFTYLKLTIKQENARTLKCDKMFSVNGRYDNSQFAYHGDTQWQRYCKFINDVLRVVRSGESDFCYHIYQICDLLRFEHDINVEWKPEDKYFLVNKVTQ